jgi:hypothetical protein
MLWTEIVLPIAGIILGYFGRQWIKPTTPNPAVPTPPNGTPAVPAPAPTLMDEIRKFADELIAKLLPLLPRLIQKNGSDGKVELFQESTDENGMPILSTVFHGVRLELIPKLSKVEE